MLPGLTKIGGDLELIETLWNVNSSATIFSVVIGDGINRNIVECKLFLRWRFDQCNFELIETLWNVNEADLIACPALVCELIETLWNVNNWRSHE